MLKKAKTIYDIAREAKVSPSTVSRVLTGSARVSDVKRAAVTRLLDKYQFQPNALARGLSESNARILGILVADIRNPYYAALVVECEKAAYNRGYTVMLCNALNKNELEDTHLEKLLAQRADAIIQIGCRADDLVPDPDYVAHVNRVNNLIPMIISGRLPGANCRSVYINHAEAMRMTIEYLISLGHEDIAIFGGARRVRSTYDKFQNYIYLCERHGMLPREEYIQEGDYTVNGGYDCMTRLLALKRRPTAAVAVNDYSAVGALKAASEQAVRVPLDCSLISFDNTFLSEVVSPKLTSVDYDYPAYGETLVSLALRAIAGEDAPREVLIDAKLVIRDSVQNVKPTDL
ncbi:MAG: LacI family transcriptional regulator [Clostridiales bacterium]|jgi:DNA-binding LacI/PurR family transcriptional regulator|nr:LacI family transcriptional regulator [Clostridiales bacterium]